MADTKISAAIAATAVLAADEFPVNEAGAPKKVTAQQILGFVLVSRPYAPGTFTVATGNYVKMTKQLVLTGAQRATLAGTARLRID